MSGSLIEKNKKLNKKEKKSLRSKARKLSQELAELLAKYDATISGCGCCDSPILTIGNHTVGGDLTLDKDGITHYDFDKGKEVKTF